MLTNCQDNNVARIDVWIERMNSARKGFLIALPKFNTQPKNVTLFLCQIGGDSKVDYAKQMRQLSRKEVTTVFDKTGRSQLKVSQMTQSALFLSVLHRLTPSTSHTRDSQATEIMFEMLIASRPQQNHRTASYLRNECVYFKLGCGRAVVGWCFTLVVWRAQQKGFYPFSIMNWADGCGGVAWWALGIMLLSAG